VDQGKSRKRSNEAVSQTLVLTKKAKNATPKKLVRLFHTRAHTALYYMIRGVSGYTI